MIQPGKIQSHNSSPKETKNNTDEINDPNTNTAPTFDFPPGFENNFKSKQNISISFENNDLLFPPGFGNINFTGSLPANISKIKPQIQNNNRINTIENDNNQPSTDNFQKLNSENKLDDDMNLANQEQAQQIPLNKEQNECLITSFSNLVYNIESNETFQPHPKPDLTRYDKLTLCSSLLSIQNFKSEKDQIEKMISAECQLCENKIHKFVDEIDQRNRQIGNMFQNLSQEVSECTSSNLNKKKCNLQIDEVVDTRNEVEIENFLREQSNNSDLFDVNNIDSQQMPKQETILNLLSILCRIYKKDKKLVFLWLKNILPCINRITDVSRLKPILLEIKRVVCCDKENADESNDISNLIDSKL